MNIHNAPYRILVVEDETIIALDIQRQLGLLGYDAVGSATSSEEALRMTASLRPDLVLMDIQIQGEIDGIAVAQIIQNRFGLPVIFLTAHATDDFLQRAKLAQPFAYLLKPFSSRELRIALELAFYKHKIDTQLRDLAAHQIQLKENERKQIARELHDDLGSLLHGIKSCIEVLIGRTNVTLHAIDPLLQQASEMTGDAIEALRNLISDLRPSVLDHLGVWAALEWYCEQLSARTGLQCQYTISPEAGNITVQPDVATTIFRIVQELLTNVVRHAHANRADVRIILDKGKLTVEVADDGSGIEPASLLDDKAWGIMGMFERAHTCHAELTIERGASGGTLATLHLPAELCHE